MPDVYYYHHLFKYTTKKELEQLIYVAISKSDIANADTDKAFVFINRYILPYIHLPVSLIFIKTLINKKILEFLLKCDMELVHKNTNRLIWDLDMAGKLESVSDKIANLQHENKNIGQMITNFCETLIPGETRLREIISTKIPKLRSITRDLITVNRSMCTAHQLRAVLVVSEKI